LRVTERLLPVGATAIVRGVFQGRPESAPQHWLPDPTWATPSLAKNTRELDEVDHAVREYLDDPDTLMMPHPLFLAWGRKPNG
jgi:hypothetical protein